MSNNKFISFMLLVAACILAVMAGIGAIEWLKEGISLKASGCALCWVFAVFIALYILFKMINSDEE